MYWRLKNKQERFEIERADFNHRCLTHTNQKESYEVLTPSFVFHVGPRCYLGEEKSESRPLRKIHKSKLTDLFLMELTENTL